MASFVQENAADLNICLSHMKYGRKTTMYIMPTEDKNVFQQVGNGISWHPAQDSKYAKYFKVESLLFPLVASKK